MKDITQEIMSFFGRTGPVSKIEETGAIVHIDYAVIPPRFSETGGYKVDPSQSKRFKMYIRHDDGDITDLIMTEDEYHALPLDEEDRMAAIALLCAMERGDDE